MSETLRSTWARARIDALLPFPVLLVVRTGRVELGLSETGGFRAPLSIYEHVQTVQLALLGEGWELVALVREMASRGSLSFFI